MSVDLRRLNVVVAQQELNVPNARPASQQVGRATMAEAMNIDSQAQLSRVAFDDLLEHMVREPVARPRQPQRWRWRRRGFLLNVAG